MAWTRVCGIADIEPGTAASYRVGDAEVLVVNGPHGTVALAAVCANVARFLIHGDYRQCVAGGVPTCNRRAAETDDAQASFGVCDEPIYAYAVRERDGSLEIDLEKTTVSPYVHISCSPVLKAGAVAALQFNLWVDGTHVHRILGRPLPQQS